MSFRVIMMATATVAVVLMFVGCSQEPQFDKTASYSPESLAQEFAFRYKGLDRSATRSVDEPVARGGVPTKGGAATKAAQVNSLDGLVDDLFAKAATIPGLTPVEARKKLAEIIARDPAVSDADKKVVVEKLGRPTD